ncbi:hypothetical protein ACIQUQ_11960 [Streptomyces sp. NPDC101118]|uniref:hypothetical protein n=1 Tax=Streptomyces sp. NPDC101118 TaxID=3366109 RepID=UPI0038105955
MAGTLHAKSVANAARSLWDELPGLRVELLNGTIIVSPVPDGPHQLTRSGIPVYVVVDRRHDEVQVLTDPVVGDYRTRSVYRRGQSFGPPASVGIQFELSVARVLDGGDG